MKLRTSNHPTGPTVYEAAKEVAESQTWGSEVVDFAFDARFHNVFYKDPTPEALKELRAFLKQEPDRFFRLYHGTSAEHPILEDGLLPTSSRRRRSLSSSAGFVYLSVFPGMAEDFGRMGAPGRPIQVYAVVTTARNLLADADQLRGRREWGGDRYADIGSSLADSLAYGRGARVRGAIPPQMITPLLSLEPPKHYPVNGLWLDRAKTFLLEGWRERAKEKGKTEPKDLSGACKFASLFALEVFGGELRGNSEHQFVRYNSATILDLTEGSSQSAAWSKAGVDPFEHDQDFWLNDEHRDSLESCLPRVEAWLEQWRAQYPLDEMPTGLRAKLSASRRAG